MSDITLNSYDIDSTLELVADHFNALAPDSSLFRAATTTDRVFLSPGLKSSTNLPLVISTIVGGPVDEYELTLTPNQVNVRLRGRDQSAFLLDRSYKVRYLRAPVPTVVAAVAPGPYDPITKTGRFFASQIAREIVASVGLTLIWGVRDYEFQENFDAVGRVIDLLRRLIEPWTLVEPLRADIFLRGTTVYIVSRTFPIVTPDRFMALRNMRRESLTLRKRRVKKVGILTLRGMSVAAALTPNPAGGGIGNNFVGGEQVEEDTVETFAADGTLISIVHTIATYAMPAHVLTHQEKVTFTAATGSFPLMTARETIDNDWEVVMFDTSGNIGQPVQRGGIITRERIDPSDDLEIFRTWDLEEIGYDYDEQGFQKGESRVTKTLDLDSGNFLNKTMNIKTNRIKGNLMVETITEQYIFDNDAQTWTIQSRDTQTQGGRRPGGPGRGSPKFSTDGGQPTSGGSNQIFLQVQLSADSDAQDVDYSNPNMTLADLQYIESQFVAVQGMWEYEARFMGVGMPWLIRGMTLRITDIILDDNAPLAVPDFLLTEVQTSYDESSLEEPKYLSTMRAFGWSRD